MWLNSSGVPSGLSHTSQTGHTERPTIPSVASGQSIPPLGEPATPSDWPTLLGKPLDSWRGRFFFLAGAAASHVVDTCSAWRPCETSAAGSVRLGATMHSVSRWRASAAKDRDSLSMLCRPGVVAYTCPATALRQTSTASPGVAPSAVPILCPAMVEPSIVAGRARPECCSGCGEDARVPVSIVSISDHDGDDRARLTAVNAADAIPRWIGGSASIGRC